MNKWAWIAAATAFLNISERTRQSANFNGVAFGTDLLSIHCMHIEIKITLNM